MAGRREPSVVKQVDEAEGRLTTVLQENLTGIRVVRAFSRQEFEVDKFLWPAAYHGANGTNLREYWGERSPRAKGRGVPRDPVKAYAWYHLAATRDRANAERARELAGRWLTEEQAVEARALAERWRNNGPPEAP